MLAAKRDLQEPHERRFVLHGVPWWTYVALRDALDEQGGGVKMTYLEGTLELMSPSTLHEDAKTIIARLIEVWAMERDSCVNSISSLNTVGVRCRDASQTWRIARPR